MTGLPAIPLHIKQAALANLKPKLSMPSGNEIKVASLKLDGKVMTLDDVRREIEIESEEGYTQALIWSRPESEINEEIRKAKSLSH